MDSEELRQSFTVVCRLFISGARSATADQWMILTRSRDMEVVWCYHFEKSGLVLAFCEKVINWTFRLLGNDFRGNDFLGNDFPVPHAYFSSPLSPLIYSAIALLF